MNADHEARNQAARYRWLGRNINDAEMKAILEAAAIDLEEHAACVERGHRENRNQLRSYAKGRPDEAIDILVM